MSRFEEHNELMQRLAAQAEKPVSSKEDLTPKCLSMILSALTDIGASLAVIADELQKKPRTTRTTKRSPKK